MWVKMALECTFWC